MRDPVALAIDSSCNLYFASPAPPEEGGGARIWKRNAADGSLTLLGGSGAAAYSGDDGPATSAGMTVAGLAVDAAGNVYFADSAARRVRKIDAVTGKVSTVAGTGEARPRTVAYAAENEVSALEVAVEPTGGLVVAANGDLYFTEGARHRVRKVSAADGRIVTFAGVGRGGWRGDGGAAAKAWLRAPAGLFLDEVGSLYIADQGNQIIRRVDPSGIISTVAGNGETGFSGDDDNALEASFNQPAALTGDANGLLYVSDLGNRRVRCLRPRGEVLAVAASAAGVAPLTVNFSAVGYDADDLALASYLWDFGDGTTAAGGTVSHLFSARGIYRVTVTGTSAVSGATYEDVVVVTVGAAEGANEGASPPSSTELLIKKLSGRLRFSAAGKDVLKYRAIFIYPAGLVWKDLPVQVAVGGLVRNFTLDRLAHAYADHGSFLLKLKPRSGGLAPLLYADVYLKGDLADELASCGAENDNLRTTLTGVKVSILLGGQSYTGTISLRYRARKDKKASLRLKK